MQKREIEVNGKVVSRLMKIDTNLKYLPSEDLFNEIYDLPYLIFVANATNIFV